MSEKKTTTAQGRPSRDEDGNARPAARLHVISCGVGFPRDGDTLALLEKADIIYGSRALLEACPVAGKRTRVIGAQARRDARDALEDARSGKRVAALSSGDALYHGFGGTLADMAGPEDFIAFHPGITAFQELFHRLGRPWQDARLFSAHSGDPLPLREIAEARLSATYGGSRYDAPAIARALLAFHPAAARRPAVVAERLGAPDERLFTGTLADAAALDCGPTSILAILPGSRPAGPSCVAGRQHRSGEGNASSAPRASLPGAPCPLGALPPHDAPILPLGLPEDFYERENNLITASDVRAVILARLRLPAWGTLWDIGAGSGSVGLEAAGLRPGLRVVAVERQPARCALIERNRRRLGVPNHTLYEGDALELLRPATSRPRPPEPISALPGFSAGACAAYPPRPVEALGKGEGGSRETEGPPSPGGLFRLPDPDRVFIGGGGNALPELLAACMERLKPGGLIVASAVTLESVHALYGWSPEHRIGLCRLDFAQEEPIAGSSHHLKHRNTITLFIFRKEIHP